MSWDKSLPLGPVFALDTLRNRVNTILKNNQNRNNTQEGDYLFFFMPLINIFLFKYPAGGPMQSAQNLTPNSVYANRMC